jgi:hypothetical protein
MNRIDLQNLAELRIKEAQILLHAASYAGAYYLAGYAVECGLKACIAKQTKLHDFPDKELVKNSYTHDLWKLMEASQLKDQLLNDMKSNKQLEAYWACVVDWDEEKRYEFGIAQKEAKDLYDAISDPTNGVLQWLKKLW